MYSGQVLGVALQGWVFCSREERSKRDAFNSGFTRTSRRKQLNDETLVTCPFVTQSAQFAHQGSRLHERIANISLLDRVRRKRSGTPFPTERRAPVPLDGEL